ncbi:MAG: hypothetical protein GTN78_19135, partial [Gemmatimonadales bacterium]|nr:hypothetical protein [Gemmatimonadales bacterium]
MRTGWTARAALTIPVTRQNELATDPSEAPLHLDDCRWVWYPEPDPRVAAAPGTRWFRREIVIPEGRKIERGRFLISADNEFVLYVNGRQAGKT